MRRDGRRHYKTFRTKEEARQWAEGALFDRRHTLLQALARYLDDVTPTKKGAKWETLRIAKFMAHPIALIPLDKLGPEHIADWRDQRLKDVGPGSVARELNIISAVLTHARKEWRWIAENPCKNVTWPRNPSPRTRMASEAEIAAILTQLRWQNRPPESSSQEVALAALLALETAMRAGEILGPKQVYPHHIHLPDTKNGEARDVPLSKEAIRLLGLIPDGFTINTKTLDVLFRRARDRAKITGLRFHDLRRTATTRLAKKLDVMQLAKMTGHKDLRTLMGTYYSPSPEDVAGRLG